MQVVIPIPARFSPDCPYDGGMGRKLTRSRPKQGERLREFRIAAGLSQYDLARLIGEPQPNIAFWELNDKPPRSDVLPKMAEALGVHVEEILGINGAQRRGGPAGKVRKLFDQVSKLPRRQQDKVIEFVSAFVEKQEQAAG